MKIPFCAVISVIGLGLSATGADLSPAGASHGDAVPSVLFVDGARGNDQAPGDEARPCKSLSGALGRLPEVLHGRVTIHLAAGTYASTGGADMPANSLVLMRRMRPGVEVRLVGHPDASGHPPVFAWEEGAAMVQATDGDWWLESIQVGSGTLRQRRGVMVQGPAHVTLKNVTCRTRSLSDAGIYTHRGGKVSLRGAIRLNEHLHESAGQETFSGIIATDHGLIRFAEREGASLSVGNGSLSASYYGVIELGCETARITSWTEQGNCLAVNNSGRIDLHNTRTTLCARQDRNTPVGLEHDGHILGEGARLIIDGTNRTAIVLQKASTLTCNDIELRGTFNEALQAMSGSMLVGRFLSDVPAVSATTGASVNLEMVPGKTIGKLTVTRDGVITLPDRTLSAK